MSRISNSVDGYAFTGHRGRFSGTIELETEEAEAVAIGETLVLVVVANVSDANAKLDKKTGDLIRIAVLKATEARVLDPELKQLLVERLGLYGSDTVEPVLITPKAASGVVVPTGVTDNTYVVPLSTTTGDSFTFIPADAETGEIWAPSEPFGDDEQMSFGEVVTVGHINGTTPSQKPPFEEYVEDDREILGRIKVSDEMAEFLAEAA